MSEDAVILDVDGSEVLVFEAGDPPDVIDGQDDFFILSVGEQGPPGVGGGGGGGGGSGNLDGGAPATIYGGTTPVDGGVP